MQRVLPAICSLVLILALALAPAQAATPWLAGHWFGTGQPDDKSKMWLETATADGGFHVLFRACVQGKPFDKTNDGTWSLSGDVETIRVDTVDGLKFAPRIDVYRILSHTADKQTYRYEPTGFVYTSHRVDGKFQMPPCDLSS